MEFIEYLRHCPPGEPFYDVVEPTADAEFSHGAATPMPADWRRDDNADWIIFNAPVERVQRQGWKIHVSATTENAARVLATVWDYCVAHRVSFKYLRSETVLRRRNGKYADRGSAGKFATLYPGDDEQLEKILNELGDLLDGERGPHILSDLRWRSGPLYVRYGAFVERTIQNEYGETVYCVEDPDGNLVPDVRGPSFRPPPWAELPGCLTEALAARNRGTLRDFPFRATKAFHFSNGGGVYYATDTRSGEVVVLKEARPLAGLDQDGRDAVARLEREHWAMDRLAGLPWIPRVIDYRIGHEHYFLAREHVEGEPLGREIARRNPLLRPDRSAADFAVYTEWALNILRQAEEAVTAMHERGVVFGDLHPANILVRADDSIAFIDLEGATEADQNQVQVMAAPGFVAPPGYTGAQVDRFGLGCIRLALFCPMTALLPWGADKMAQLLDLVTTYFPVPADFADQVRHDLGPAPHWNDLVAQPADRPPLDWPEPGPAAWPELRAAIADGIAVTATPERTDRLFPGDIAQFHLPGGGAAFAHGAAGVLWSLAEAGVDVPEEQVDWLARRSREGSVTRPGFYDGLSGVAYALDRLGRTAEALETLERAASIPLDRVPGIGLYSGLAGAGLTLRHFGRDCGAVTELLIERLPLKSEGPPPGLMHGASGAALLLLRLYADSRDPALLRHAEAALRRDLAVMGAGTGVPAPIGAPWREPVLELGGAGVAMVLRLLIEHYPDPELLEVLDDLRRALGDHVVTGAGLFAGRAGVMLALARLGERPDSPRLARHLKHLAWHAVPRDGRVAFIGEQALRLSADLATGSAGVLLGLHTALGGGTGLPFLEPAATRHDTCTTTQQEIR
ncbi:class III lanthionine synthetase LanKC [Nonomuraea monospora]|uniref:non-specific serine/threonine protein kinase n=1 Tax=Nonomuraea monospora TaxID=568818 RepID=A0ABN3D290_9ACTN